METEKGNISKKYSPVCINFRPGIAFLKHYAILIQICINFPIKSQKIFYMVPELKIISED